MRSLGQDPVSRQGPEGRPRSKHRRKTAIGRSFDVYYRDTARTERMDHLNASFVRRDALVFDIGAHVGDRTGSFLRLGASVVALEPQPPVFRALRLIHGRHPGAMLLRAAAGAQPGEIEMYVNSANPTVSTASRDLVDAANGAGGWQGQVWDDRIRVPVTTLDQLIAQHGAPDFVKIDVEGHEHAALLGLSTPLPALSFEFTTIQRDIAHACLERMSSLGRYVFNLSLGEDHRLRHPDWISESEMRAEISALPDSANSGDVYAKRL